MDIDKLEKILDVKFENISIITEALTHKSYINEVPHEKHNERMEFLGDAVLELVVTKYLFEKYPTRPEGELTSFRAAVVRTESLANSALEISLGNFLRMSKGEESTGGRIRPYILANAFEAVIGAVYLDLGLDAAAKFIEKYIISKIDEVVENRLDLDAKSKLQEFVQEKMRQTPQYKTIKEEGPDHDKIFTVGVVINEKVYESGTGKTKQTAEQNAALATLALLQSSM